MFNRSEILSAAWASYNAQIASARAAAVAAGLPVVQGFRRRLFASHLKSAWTAAKRRAYLETQIAAEATFTPEVKAIRAELQVMDFSDAPTDWERRRTLTAALFRACATA